MKEAAPILLRRSGRFLMAADRMTETFIESLPQGKTLRARDITQPRSRARLRLYWALMHLAADNMEAVTVQALHKWMKVRLGIVEAIPLRNGKVEFVDGSIAFDKLSEEEFAPYLDKVIGFIVEELIPGLGRDDLMAMAKEMTA